MKNICTICEDEFIRKSNTSGLYCSISCSNIDRYRKNKERYEENPKLCLCGNPIPYNEKNHNTYCSRSCSAIFNNKKRSRKSRDKQRISLLQTMGISNSDTTDLDRYRRRCRFKFRVTNESKKIPGVYLLNEIDIYCPRENRNGWTRDHMYSILDGFQNHIDSEIIKHPANCRVMLNNANSKKGRTSSITITELLERIKNWDLSFN